DIALNLVRRPPLRTSALRSLGGTMNVLAIEGFLDELAEAAGASPLAFRLALTSDRRARKVIEKAAAMGGFANRGPSSEGIGLGMGYARYKNSGAYLCAVAEVEATAEPRVLRLWLACDPGLVINPDGAVNQLEGGAVQAISWTLKEEIRIEGGRIASTDWRAYPILRFSEAPAIETTLLPEPGEPPAGLGEAAAGPVSAAVVNALSHALGLRLRDLPLTRERILAAMR
ncbi:MAG: molybdopterin cofactor-binding domain-containing protein, partial [Caulobacteraceae bacterium]